LMAFPRRLAPYTLASLLLLLLLWVEQGKEEQGELAGGEKQEEQEGQEEHEEIDEKPNQKTLEERLGDRRRLLAPVFGDRLGQVAAACDSMERTNTTMRHPERLNRHWTVSPHRRLALCRLAKHASTTWASYFVRIYDPEFSGSRAQETSRHWEAKFLTQREKLSVIQSVARPSHDYFAFFVCRDPLAKLLSTFRYNRYLVRRRRADRAGFPVQGLPTWQGYLALLTSGALDSGTTHSMYRSCDLCGNQWDAVIHMDTFASDTRAILRASVLGHLAPAHLNRHGQAGRTGVDGPGRRGVGQGGGQEPVRQLLHTGAGVSGGEVLEGFHHLWLPHHPRRATHYPQGEECSRG